MPEFGPPKSRAGFRTVPMPEVVGSTLAEHLARHGPGPAGLAFTNTLGNAGGDSVTELSASTGALVRVISGSSYKFDSPDALAADGGDLFVANYDGDSVTELSASSQSLQRHL